MTGPSSLCSNLQSSFVTTTPRIIVAVSNDLSTDQRVHRSCLLLQQQGFRVLLAGRQLPGSLPLDRPYDTRRLRLLFRKGPLFYACLNVRLFFLMMFARTDMIFCNDLDTLAAGYLAARLKRKPLVYDTHEYFTGVPELEQRPFVQSVWKRIERWIFPKLKVILTVNDSIAGLYEKEYRKKLIVIRNIPGGTALPPLEGSSDRERELLGLPKALPILVLQGAGINVDRGAEEAVEAMRYLEGMRLLIIGGGDVMPRLNRLVEQYNLKERVIFKPKMPHHEMMQYTRVCDLGLTLDKDTNINYRYSLPNKVFDYIHAGIPVLASRLPEVEKIVKDYGVGDFIESHDPVHIAEKIRSVIRDHEKVAQWKKNLQLACLELNWAGESLKFPDLRKELNG